MAERVTLQTVINRLITDTDFEKDFNLDNFFSTNIQAIRQNVSQK